MARLPGDILRDIHLGLGALSPADKAEVAEVLVDDLSGMGRVNDTDLAHITPAEAMMLRQAGGAGTLNPETGLPEYMTSAVAGGSPGVAATGTGTGTSGPGAGGMFGGFTYGGPPGMSTSPGSAAVTAALAAAQNAPSEFGWTPAEAQAIRGDSGDAATAEGFSFADTSTESQIAFDNAQIAKQNVLVDKSIIPELARFDFIDFDTRDRPQQDTFEFSYRPIEHTKRIQQQVEQMQQLKQQQLKQQQQQNYDLSRNIDNPWLPRELKKTDRSVLKTKDGNVVQTTDSLPIDFPNLSIENAINSYITETAEKNPTMYGLEKYNEPYRTVSEQLGFDRSSWLSRTEKAAQDSWVSRQTSDLGKWIGDNMGKVSDFVGDAPFMAFLSRNPLSVVKSFIAEMLAKQTPALQDKTKMYLAAQSYVQRGLDIPEVSELAAHDFSAQPYLGEETFTDQWKTLPSFEQVRGLEEKDRLEQERIQKKLEEEFRAAQLEELSKYFETVSDDYLDLRKQQTYNPIGLEQLLGNT